jgi:hypothetical protein
MARRGFLSRVFDRIREVVAPRPPEREREQPPPQPPKERPSEYRGIWRSHGGKGSYQKNLKVFHAMIDPIEDDPSERVMLWDSYVRNINKGEGRFRRQSTSNLFWRDSGIDPESFRWQEWREAMGYTGKRRSRTP